jgi:hypothetical protein
MKRFEKIVLEQKIRKGNMGVRKIDGPLASRTAKYFTNVDDLVTSFYYVDKHGKGKKYTPLTSNELVQRWLPTLFELQKYNTKDYIVILDTDSQVTDKTESVWDVFVVNRNSISKIPDSDIKKLGNVGSAPLISLIEFQRLKKQNELAIAKEKADAAAAAPEAEAPADAPEAEAPADAPAAEAPETIDPNNLGKGTPDAKAFQELLYQVGLKLIPTYIAFKKFAYWRTKGPDGGWDGDIGVATLNMLDKLSLKDKYKSGDKAGVIKDLRDALKTNESINYFKGTGMNVKLKDLLREEIIIKSDDEVVGGGGQRRSVSGGGNTPKPKNNNFTPKTFPTKYTGTGKITYDNGDTFKGSWENGVKKGQGTHTLKTGKIYDGTWSNGKKSGEFKITYPNGDIRVGTVINGKLDGLVKFTPKGGKSVEETWKDNNKILGIDDLYKESAANIKSILLKAVYYITDHSRFSGYKGETWLGDDKEGAALREVVLPWFQKNIQPLQLAHYNKYIKPYMEKYGATGDSLTIDYDLEFASANKTLSLVDNGVFRKMLENYLILKANCSNTSLKHPWKSAAYYNYAKGSSAYTLAAMFYNNTTSRALYYWGADKQKKSKSVDTDF